MHQLFHYPGEQVGLQRSNQDNGKYQSEQRTPEVRIMIDVPAAFFAHVYTIKNIE